MMTIALAVLWVFVGINGVLLWRVIRLKRGLEGASRQLADDARGIAREIGVELAEKEAAERYLAAVRRGVIVQLHDVMCPEHSKVRQN